MCNISDTIFGLILIQNSLFACIINSNSRFTAGIAQNIIFECDKSATSFVTKVFILHKTHPRINGSVIHYSGLEHFSFKKPYLTSMSQSTAATACLHTSLKWRPHSFSVSLVYIHTMNYRTPLSQIHSHATRSIFTVHTPTTVPPSAYDTPCASMGKSLRRLSHHLQAALSSVCPPKVSGNCLLNTVLTVKIVCPMY